MSNRRMTFGMYKGREINDVIAENPKYIEWCMHFVSFFSLTEKEQTLLSKEIQSYIPKRNIDDKEYYERQKVFNDVFDDIY